MKKWPAGLLVLAAVAASGGGGGTRSARNAPNTPARIPRQGAILIGSPGHRRIRTGFGFTSAKLPGAETPAGLLDSGTE